MLHVCNACGNHFEAKATAKFCSPKCRTRAHRRGAQVDNNNLAQWPYCLDDKKEDFWAIRDLSERAAATIKIIFDTYGLDAARLAIVATWQLYNNENYARFGDDR